MTQEQTPKYEDIPSKKPKMALPLTVIITVEADELLRSHCRRKGDISRQVEMLIMEKWGPKT
jgi:hypothetical protein